MSKEQHKCKHLMMVDIHYELPVCEQSWKLAAVAHIQLA